MLGISAVCQAQTLSVRPYVNYHHSVSKQNEPVFHSLGNRVTFPFGFRLINENFTLSSGFEYGVAVDYRFRNDLGVELGVGYFSSINSHFEHSQDTRISYKTDWNYNSIVVRPQFSYAVMSGKSAFIGKVGPIFHYSSAEFSTFVHNDWHISDCVFDSKWSFGYSVGLEYNYRLSERLHLAVNFGYEQYRFIPNKATVDIFSLNSVTQYEIHYVNKIVGEPYSLFNPNQNDWLKESILFNNIHFGIGIKYNLWKK